MEKNENLQDKSEIENENTDNVRAQEIKYTLEFTSLRDITSSVSICFDPDDLQTLIEEDRPLMEEYASK